MSNHLKEIQLLRKRIQELEFENTALKKESYILKSKINNKENYTPTVNEERLKIATEAGNVGIWDWNIVDNVLIWDESMYRLYGLNESDFSGAYDAWSKTLYKDDSKRAEKAVENALANISPFDTDFRIVSGSGEVIHIHAYANVTFDSNGNPLRMVGVNLNTTTQILAEIELKKAKEAAESEYKIKSSFLANMSHEIRTPMNAILGYAQILQRDKTLSTKHQKHIYSINRSGEHLLHLLNDVLDMSKIEAGKIIIIPDTFHIHKLLFDVYDMFKLMASKKKLHIELNIDSELPDLILADSNRIRQVLINLLSNALKYTKEGGVSISARLFEGQIQTIIKDTGVGIKQEEIDNVFGVFEQTEVGARTYGSSGLGLSISKQLAVLMGGDIIAKSKKNIGSRFYFNFDFEPGLKENLLNNNAEQRVRKLADSNNEVKVLIVDDVEENRTILKSILEPVGFNVEDAADGYKALEIYEKWKPDVMLLDVVMPKLGGKDVIKKIKSTKQGRETLVIAISASIFDEEHNEIMELGANDFMLKPFKVDELFNKLKFHLDLEYEYDKLKVSRDYKNRLINWTDSLENLPEQLLIKINKAAKEGDVNLLESQIDEIKPYHEELAQFCAELIHEFELELIIQLFNSEVNQS